MQIAYGEVTFALTHTTSAERLTDRDVEVAKKISSSIGRARDQVGGNSIRPFIAVFTNVRRVSCRRDPRSRRAFLRFVVGSLPLAGI